MCSDDSVRDRACTEAFQEIPSLHLFYTTWRGKRGWVTQVVLPQIIYTCSVYIIYCLILYVLFCLLTCECHSIVSVVVGTAWDTISICPDVVYAETAMIKEPPDRDTQSLVPMCCTMLTCYGLIQFPEVDCRSDIELSKLFKTSGLKAHLLCRPVPG